ncbi:MAG: hypothetical protein LBR13_07430 [Dysgonamonadaceae bacterium]|jgi:hypothetical protein|nr:hypothetical protein [Dysgonamonadaceae bacterium]
MIHNSYTAESRKDISTGQRPVSMGFTAYSPYVVASSNVGRCPTLMLTGLTALTALVYNITIIINFYEKHRNKGNNS